jgi:secreted trypsin-like serine protease
MGKVIWGALLLALALSCGQTKNGNIIDSKIIGGEIVTDREYDFTVGLFNETGRFFCSGALVSPTLVLTAAHCVLGHNIKSVGVGNSAPFEHYPAALFSKGTA